MVVPRQIKRFGWRPDLPDVRDLLYVPPPEVAAALPATVDLRPEDVPVVDQGQLGSCTANGIAGVVGFAQRKAGETVVPLSRLFIYYGEREMEGTVGQDSGAMIRDGIHFVHRDGAPPETDWPYDISRFAERPPDVAYADAATNLVASYHRVGHTHLDTLRACLAEGWPVVFGFTVYDSFESAAVAGTGVVPYPAGGESVLGGHCMVIVGYDDNDDDGRFVARNSWGTAWGQDGYCTMPYRYLTSRGLASDFWTVRRVA